MKSREELVEEARLFWIEEADKRRLRSVWNDSNWDTAEIMQKYADSALAARDAEIEAIIERAESLCDESPDEVEKWERIFNLGYHGFAKVLRSALDKKPCSLDEIRKQMKGGRE